MDGYNEFEGYVGHGICLLLNEDNIIQFILFGGIGLKPFIKSFNQFTARIKLDENNLNLSSINEDSFNDYFDITQKQIEGIKCDVDSLFHLPSMCSVHVTSTFESGCSM